MAKRPQLPHVEPQQMADERTTLFEFLDYFRETLLRKVEGLSTEQARVSACPPSTLNLLGLVRHMADVERHWFRRVLCDQAADPIFYTDDNEEGDMQPDQFATLEEGVLALRAEIAMAQANCEPRDLDDLCARERRGAPVTLRWVVVHMIEEYARHCGHADLLREAIDGTVGD